MIKVLLIIFTYTYGGNTVPTIVPMDSMDACINAKTRILAKYHYTGLWHGPHEVFSESQIDCFDISPLK
jgi:hypothetical protein